MSERNGTASFVQRHQQRSTWRQELAAEIADKFEKLGDCLNETVPIEEIEHIIGKGAFKEIYERKWAISILLGMAEGKITVGDPRLAEMLQRIEDSLNTVPLETLTSVYEKYRTENDEPTLALRQARASLDDITRGVVEAGLTTPGQDLYAEPRDRGRGGL